MFTITKKYGPLTSIEPELKTRTHESTHFMSVLLSELKTRTHESTHFMSVLLLELKTRTHESNHFMSVLLSALLCHILFISLDFTCSVAQLAV